MENMRILTSEEVDQVSGGILPLILIPAAKAFVEGAVAGAAVATAVVAVLDAFDIGDWNIN